MKRKIIFILTLLLISTSLIFASNISSYIGANIGGNFLTNAYSNPLPQNGDESWLKWRSEFPYLTRWDVTGTFQYNIFFSDESRTGISFDYTIGYPIFAKTTKPTGDFTLNSWEYTEYDSLENQKLLHNISLGPNFKVRLGNFDVGMAFRFGCATLDNFKSAIFNVIAEPYFNYIFDCGIYLTSGLTYTAYLMKYINDPVKRYEDYFTMMSIRPFIGMGIYIK